MAGVDGGARPRSRWDVALSFAGAQRGYVEQVAGVLQARGVSCFYDADEQIELWGKYLAEELSAIYGEQAAAVVVFVSAEYAARDWTRLERRAALNRAVRERREYVLPARFDDTPLPGLLSDMVAIDLCSRAPEQFAAMIAAKLAALGVITPTSGGGESLLYDAEAAPLTGAVRASDADLRPLGVPAAIGVPGIPDEVPRVVCDHRNGPIRGPHLVPSLPGWYVKRPALLDELARLVVAPQTPAEQPVALVGMGGAGKTVLAAAVTELPEVRRRFRDGVAWVSVGRRSLPEAQATLAIQLDGQSLGADVEHNRSLLAKQLKDVACLVVLDDVLGPGRPGSFRLPVIFWAIAGHDPRCGDYAWAWAAAGDQAAGVRPVAYPAGALDQGRAERASAAGGRAVHGGRPSRAGRGHGRGTRRRRRRRTEMGHRLDRRAGPAAGGGPGQGRPQVPQL